MSFQNDPIQARNCRNGGRSSKRTRVIERAHQREDDEPSVIERPRKLRCSEQAVRFLRRLWPDPVELSLNLNRKR